MEWTLSPPGEYGGLICVVEAMRAVDIITVATC